MSYINKIYNLCRVVCIVVLSMGMFQGCSDDNDVPYTTGISNEDWTEINDALIEGEILMFNFEAAAEWTATSDAEWCEVLTPKGVSGTSTLRLKVVPNPTLKGRSASVTISVEAAAEQVLLTIRQGEGDIEHGTGTYREVNKWVYEYMSEMYLWNENIPQLSLDFSIGYQNFLRSMLDGIATFDNVNQEDGGVINGERIYFTELISNAPETRVVGSNYNDSGIMGMSGAKFDLAVGGMAVGLVVKVVAPNTEADKAGIKRGDFITQVNGITITESNYQSLASNVFSGNVTVTVNDVTFDNGLATMTSRGDIWLSSSRYVDPAIYKASIVNTPSGKRAGYLLLMGFDINYDEQLIEVFKQFADGGIDDLIIDLRYNPGGMVLSSTVLGTLVAGAEHKDKVYMRTTYNSARMATGESGEYLIGNAANPESEQGYENIAKALETALGMKRVFVITSGVTASASELVINGLRGLGIEVNTIGQKTLGKNVGMEGIRKEFLRYSFTFYPITFYCENALGFRDYSDGFVPTLELDDANYYPGDFATGSDYLSGAALLWIDKGSKPNLTRSLSESVVIQTLDVIGDRNVSRHMGGSIIMREK